MKALVAYYSETGNTKKVAEAIYEEIQWEKEIKELAEIDNVNDCDLIFVGFPMQAFAPAQAAKDFLENQCKNRKVALFTTHAVSEDFEKLPRWIENCREAAAGSEVAGIFNCQGEVADYLLEMMISSDDAESRILGEAGATSKGQPDASRIERARTFAKEMTA